MTTKWAHNGYLDIDCENCGRHRVLSDYVCDKCGYNNLTHQYETNEICDEEIKEEKIEILECIEGRDDA